MKHINNKNQIARKKKVKFFIGLGAIVLTIIGISLSVLFSCKPKNILAEASKNLSKYKISATFFDESKTVEGICKLDYVNNEDTSIDMLCFHLYGRAFREDAIYAPYTATNAAKCFPTGQNYGDMQVSKVTENNSHVSFEIGGDGQDILIVPLSTPIEQKQKTTIEISFVLILSENVHRLGYFQDNVNLGNWFPILCAQIDGEFLLDSYYSTGDPFCSDCANYEVEFSYPSGYEFYSSGNKKETKVQNSNKTSICSAKAIRDFSIILTKNSMADSENVDNTIVTYVGQSKDEDIEKSLETSVLALKTFNKLFGKYPYKTLTVISTNFMFGGMEYPNLVWISNTITDKLDKTKVIVHEIAHQWWYGLVGNDEVSEAWLDEALAEYSTVLFFENNPEYDYSGKQMVVDASISLELYNEIIASIGATSNTKMTLKVYDYSSDFEYVYMVYVKGILLFDAIREELGNKNFLECLKYYFKKNMFKISTAENLFFAFQNKGNVDVMNIFERFEAV